MRKHLFLLVLLSATFCFAFTQPLHQTRTATYLNNLNNFRDVFGDQGYPRATAADLAVDDNIYGCTRKLRALRDSAAFGTYNSFSSLALQGFGFTIPDGSTIDSIALRVRRFKDGRPPIGDHVVSLMQRFQSRPDTPAQYGVFWSSLDDYPGKLYPDIETEYVFSQKGGGTNGGYFHDETYQWTPAIVNHLYFGVRIDTYAAIGRGTVEVCYDLVDITVYYSPPAAAAKLPLTLEISALKKPIVFPNPFTTKTNIQFTAAESGKTVVELYDINGAKVRTLFSGNVVQGEVYNVTTGERQLSKGTYIYRVSNGRQKYVGKIVKLE